MKALNFDDNIYLTEELDYGYMDDDFLEDDELHEWDDEDLEDDLEDLSDEEIYNRLYR